MELDHEAWLPAQPQFLKQLIYCGFEYSDPGVC